MSNKKYKKEYSNEEKLRYYREQVIFCSIRIEQIEQQIIKNEFKKLRKEIAEEYRKKSK